MNIILTAHKFFIAFILLIFVCCLYFIKDTQVVYDFESLFPKGDPDLEFYSNFKKDFEPDDNLYIIAIEEDRGFFTEKKLSAFRELEDSVRLFSLVEESVSPLSTQFPVKSPFGYLSVPAVHYESPSRYTEDSLKMMKDPLLVNRLVSPDGKSFLLLLKTIYPINQDQAEKLHDKVISLLRKSPFKKYHTAGRATIQTEFVRFQLREMFLYTSLALILVIVVLSLIFRRIVPVFLAVLTVGIALVIFLGSVAFFEIKLDFISALFPILMLIVGMSDVIHLLSKYIEELQRGIHKKTALENTIREIGVATFLTSLTTAIGFMALLSSRIEPIRHFGLTAAYGVFLAYIITVVFVPASLMLFKPERVISKNNFLDKFDPLLKKIYLHSKSGRYKIALSAIILTILFIWGSSKIDPQGRLKNDLPANQKVTYDYEFFEENFGGFRPFELALMPVDGYSFRDIAVLEEVNKLEHYLKESGLFHSMFSPNDVFRSIQRSLGSNRLNAYKLPEDQADLNKGIKELEKIPGKPFNRLLSENFKLGRLTAKMPDIGSSDAESYFDTIRMWGDKNIDHSIIDFRITGTSILFDNNHKYLVKSLFSGLFVAFLLVSLLMTILFKNWKMVFISLIPNMLPLVATGAFLGFSNISLDATSSIIFTISFGIAVDDTIHFLSRYKLERMRGIGVDRSIYRALTQTGKAILITTIVLFAGFMILTTSNLSGTFKVGLLTSLTLVSALLADLYLIPVLIWFFYKKEK